MFTFASVLFSNLVYDKQLLQSHLCNLPVFVALVYSFLGFFLKISALTVTVYNLVAEAVNIQFSCHMSRLLCTGSGFM